MSDEDNQTFFENSLSANTGLGTTLLDPFGSLKEATVVPKGFTYQSSLSNRGEILGSPEVSDYQNSITANRCSIEVSPIEFNSSQDSITKISIGEVSSYAISTSQISPSQISITEIGFTQVNTKQFNANQVSMTKVGTAQIDTDKFRPTQVNFTQIDFTQRHLPKSNSSKISVSGSVSFEQLLAFNNFSFDIQNYTPQFIDNINSTALTFWNLFLQPSILFNINLQITDLPPGQLAEAVITQYDPSGHPNGGTLLIDRDANGLGWYIDPTPCRVFDDCFIQITKWPKNITLEVIGFRGKGGRKSDKSCVFEETN